MTANFVDQFGFNDEEFSEHEENIKYVINKLLHLRIHYISVTIKCGVYFKRCVFFVVEIVTDQLLSLFQCCIRSDW